MEVNRASGIQSDVDNNGFFWAEEAGVLPGQNPDTVDSQKASDPVDGGSRGSRDVEVSEPLPRRAVLSEGPQPILPEGDLGKWNYFPDHLEGVMKLGFSTSLVG